METCEPVALDSKNGNWKLYNSSAETFLESLHDESIDFFLTDVPYGITQDKHDDRLTYEQIKSFSLLLRKKLKPDGGFFTFINFAALNDWNRGLYSAGFRTIRVGSWIKTNGYIKPCPYPTNAMEFFVFTTRKSNRNKTILPFYLSGQSQKLKAHESEIVSYRKPVSLLRTIVLNHTNEGDVVVDGFCGSGSTGIAALLEGRKAILNDIDSLKIDGISNNLHHYLNYSGHKPKEAFLIKERRGNKDGLKDEERLERLNERARYAIGEKKDRRKTKKESNVSEKTTTEAQVNEAEATASKGNKTKRRKGFTIEQKAVIQAALVKNTYEEKMSWVKFSETVREGLGRKREVERGLLLRTCKAIQKSAKESNVILNIPDASQDTILASRLLELVGNKKPLK